jgi:hypothetical protein
VCTEKKKTVLDMAAHLIDGFSFLQAAHFFWLHSIGGWFKTQDF